MKSALTENDITRKSNCIILGTQNRFIFFIVVIFLSSAHEQAKANLDSLLQIWQNETYNDSLRAQALDDYIWEGYLFSHPDSSILMAQALFDFAENRHMEKAKASALNLQGIAYCVKADYPKALWYFQQCKEIRTKIGDRRGIANALNNIGIIYRDKSEFIKALHYFQQSLSLVEEIGYQQGIGNSLNNIGNVYKELEDFENSLDYYQRSLIIVEKLGDKQGIGNTLNNIATIYKDEGNYPKAFEFSKKSLQVKEEIDDKKGIGDALTNLGDIYKNQSNYVTALKYYEESKYVSTQIGDKQGIVANLVNIGVIFQNQKKYSKALKNCKLSYEIAKEIGALIKQKEACQCLYAVNKTLNNGNDALYYHELILDLNDKIHAEEAVKQLQQMEFSKQVLADSLAQVEKNQIIQMKHEAIVRKKEKNRNYALGMGLIFLMVAGGFFSRWRYIRKSKAILEKEKDRSENLLLNILPAEIAEELKQKGEAIARDFDQVSILFTDFKDFTQLSEKLTAKELVFEINFCFKAFDKICTKYGVEKIKTIGDSYMAAGGLPIPNPNSAKNTLLAAIEMSQFILLRQKERIRVGLHAFEMRTGIHTGPVVAGIVGVNKFQYDIWGDSVNTASRMETQGAVGKVNISHSTYELLKDDYTFTFEYRGMIQAKGKGKIEMYFASMNHSLFESKSISNLELHPKTSRIDLV